MSPSLILNGNFYPSYRKSNDHFSPETFECAEKTVRSLLQTNTTSDHPGMLLGKVQSGKTRTFISILALSFDNGFDIAVVLSKNSRPLIEQTYKRLRSEFKPFVEEGELEIYDIMNCPESFSKFELDSKLVFVAKKQSDNLSRLQSLFTEKCPAMKKLRVLIIDDEADSASIGYTKRSGEIEANTIARQISDFRGSLDQVSFLQVTATPYSLYLQPGTVEVANVVEFKPTRPAFTELVPVPSDYVGGDTYFGESSRSEEDTLESLIHHAVDTKEFDRLKKQDNRSFKPDEFLVTPLYQGFRHALVAFFVGGCIQRLNGIAAGKNKKKLYFSFLLHSEAAKGAHAWQEKLAKELVNRLGKSAVSNDAIFSQLVRAAYDDLSRSLAQDDQTIPPFETVLSEVKTALLGEYITISKVNSDDVISALLDDSGQLKLRSPLCVFIGGQVLDRGVTLANLIGFYYGRRPKKYQQDTVLQHSRMYGYRRADLAVTRFYTSPAIRHAMGQMEEFDVSLRSAIEAGGDRTVQFIRRADDGRIVPCSPNKILVADLETLRPFKRLLPVGFQTGFKKDIQGHIQQIDTLIRSLVPTDEPTRAFLIPLELAIRIVKLTYQAFEFEEGFPNNEAALLAALAHLSANSVAPTLKHHVWCVYREGRTIARIRADGRMANAPDTPNQEGKVAREAAETVPALMLLRQEGRKEDGWTAGPFYWPVVIAPRNSHTAVFAPETLDAPSAVDSEDEDEEES